MKSKININSISKERIATYKQDATKLVTDAKSKKVKDVTVLSERTTGTSVKKYSKKRADGWINAITGLGGTQDKSYHTSFQGYTYIPDTTLAEIWVGDGFGKRIVNVVAEDMTREWISIENDTDSVITNKLKLLEAQNEFNLVLNWQRLFAGGIIVMGINDTNLIEEPLNMNTIKSVDYLKTYDRTDIMLTDVNFDKDPNSKNFGKVEFYTITPRTGAPFNVHRTRVLEFKGTPVPNRVDSGNFWYWGMGELQSIWDNLQDLGASIRSSSKILYEFIIGKYKFKDLATMLAEGNEDKIIRRMNIIDLAKSTIQAIMLDEDEEYSRDSANIAGLPEVLDRYMMFLSGVSGIPVTRLFGRSPAGENATGEGDQKVYYDTIRSKQGTILEPRQQRLVDIINASDEITNKVKNPMVKSNSLFQQTEKEKVENRKTQSDTDAIYIDRGVLSSDEVRESRFGGEGYSFDTNLMEPSDGESDFNLEE